jgi:coatomer subunit epsilon
LQALSLAAKYHSASSAAGKEMIVEQLKSLVASSGTPGVQLAAAQVFLDAGLMKEALQCVHTGPTMEHISLILQVYLRIDRLDLAQQQLRQMKVADEDAILTQLGGIYCNLAIGSSGAADALHSVSALLEQYGPSPLLFNIMASALILKGAYADAEQRLQECLQEFPADSNVPDTLINLIVCSQHQQKPTQPYVNQMKEKYPSHTFCAGIDRVQAAFDREVGKYKV